MPMTRHARPTRIAVKPSPRRVAAIGITTLCSLCVLPGTLGAQTLAPIPIELPKPMFEGTPQNLAVPHLQKPLGRPRDPFLAPAGVTNVAPGLKELRVTFNLPMGGGFSWTGGGADFPKIPAGQQPRWSEDRKTCVLPVELKPNCEYRLGLNCRSHKNFQSVGGVPLDPILFTFKTRSN